MSVQIENIETVASEPKLAEFPSSILDNETLIELPLAKFIKAYRQYADSVCRYLFVLPGKSILFFRVEEKVKTRLSQGIAKSVIFTRIPIKLTISEYGPDRGVKINLLNLDWHNADTLITLLSLKPEELRIEYMPDNTCTLFEEKNLTQETILFRGASNLVEISHVGNSEFTKIGAYVAHFEA